MAQKMTDYKFKEELNARLHSNSPYRQTLEKIREKMAL